MQGEEGGGKDVGSTKRMGNLSSAFEKANHSTTYPYGAMNFIPALAIRFRIVNSLWGGAVALKDSQKVGHGDFSENLRAFLFNKDRSNETNFSWIRLAGQYL